MIRFELGQRAGGDNPARACRRRRPMIALGAGTGLGRPETRGHATMRFMIIRRAALGTEAGNRPGEAMPAAMDAYNQAMIDAGLFRVGEGLHPSAKGARIRFSGGVPTIIDGPFAETREVIAGFTTVEVAWRAEALDRVRRWPEADAELELRPVLELWDFAVGPAEAPEGWRAREQVCRTRADGQPDPGTS